MSRNLYNIYRILASLLPKALQQSLGSSVVMRPLRDVFLRNQGHPRIVDGQVKWEDLTFTFMAPYKIFWGASRSGIENRICRLARSILRPGDTAIDVGANYGFVSLVMGKSVAPNGNVISFEIDTTIARVLVKTMEINNLSIVSQIISKGAGPKTAGCLVTVDSVIKKISTSNIKFMKVDTDGDDFGVLNGSLRLLKQSHPVIVVELTDKQEDIFDLLRSCEYRYFMGMNNESVVPGCWPPNLIASIEPVKIPERGHFILNE
jgi:hypothetical protein